MNRFPILLGLTLLLVGAADPRPDLIELQLSGSYMQALDEVNRFVLDHPEQARELGLDYLRGHLLEQLGRFDESPAAFAEAMTLHPLLTGHGRFRLALNRYRQGQPEVAAGLLVTLLANDPSPSLVPAAVDWLTASLQDGGDCRLLSDWPDWQLRATQIRKLQGAVIGCAFESGDPYSDRDLMIRLLRGDHTDDTAWRAAVGLSAGAPDDLDPSTRLLIGMAFFHHRDFRRALPFLVSSLEDSQAATANLRKLDRADVLYSLARSHYWLGQFQSAVQVFSQVATEETASEKIARAHFHKGRSLALLGDWDAAIVSFDEAAMAAPTDSWAAAALLSAMRLEWRQGREAEALNHFDGLRSRRSWRISLERAAIFLAVSDLVKGRSDRAAPWLEIARQARREAGAEIDYWQGRLAELESQSATAVDRYRAVLARDPFHPLSLAARERLAQSPLDRVAQAKAQELQSSSQTADLRDAWLLLGPEGSNAGEIAQRLIDRWSRSSRIRPYLEMEATRTEEWRIWEQRLRKPEQILLALGIAETPSRVLKSSFPLDDTGLALAGSRLLSSNGLHRRSLYNAEVVSHRVPTGVPPQFLPETFRRLLFPRSYAFQIEQQARRFGVDKDLLSAIIREESRFDPMAISAASARGLTQFVWPTAQRLGKKLDLLDLTPADLHRPEVAITLGAAYLAELAEFFDGNTGQMITAYNAGEDLARLWQAYCFSQEPEEYFSKVGFRQTRNYLEKVSRSRNQYTEIYSSRTDP